MLGEECWLRIHEVEGKGLAVAGILRIFWSSHILLKERQSECFPSVDSELALIHPEPKLPQPKSGRLRMGATREGYLFFHGTPDWLRAASLVGVALLLILGSVYTIFPPKDGRIRSGLFTIIFPPSWQRWLLDDPVNKDKQIF